MQPEVCEKFCSAPVISSSRPSGQSVRSVKCMSFCSVLWSRKVGTCALQTATVACWNMSTEAYLLAHPQPCGHCVARRVGVSPKSSVMSDTFAGSKVNEEGWRCKPEAILPRTFQLSQSATSSVWWTIRSGEKVLEMLSRSAAHAGAHVRMGSRQVKPTRCAVWSSSKPLGIRVVEGSCIPFR